jgi:hypothetical protein
MPEKRKESIQIIATLYRHHFGAAFLKVKFRQSILSNRRLLNSDANDMDARSMVLL